MTRSASRRRTAATRTSRSESEARVGTASSRARPVYESRDCRTKNSEPAKLNPFQNSPVVVRALRGRVAQHPADLRGGPIPARGNTGAAVPEAWTPHIGMRAAHLRRRRLVEGHVSACRGLHADRLPFRRVDRDRWLIHRDSRQHRFIGERDHIGLVDDHGADGAACRGDDRRFQAALSRAAVDDQKGASTKAFEHMLRPQESGERTRDV